MFYFNALYYHVLLLNLYNVKTIVFRFYSAVKAFIDQLTITMYYNSEDSGKKPDK
jgi:hypothetical protein